MGVFKITCKTIHFIPMILSVCLPNNFQYKCCLSREIRGKSFVKIYVRFSAYEDSSHDYDFLCVLELLMSLEVLFPIQVAVFPAGFSTRLVLRNIYNSLNSWLEWLSYTLLYITLNGIRWKVLISFTLPLNLKFANCNIRFLYSAATIRNGWI